MRFSFSAGLMIRRGEQCFEFERQLLDGRVVFTDVLTKAPWTLATKDLLEAIEEHKVEVVLESGVACKATPRGVQSGEVNIDVSTLPAVVRDRAEYRMKWVNAMRQRGVSRGATSAIKHHSAEFAQRWGVRPPGVTTLARWMRDFEAGGRTLLSLVDCPRRRVKRTNDKVRELATKILRKHYFSRERASIRDCFDRLQIALKTETSAGRMVPEESKISLSTLQRIVNETPLYVRLSKRHSETHARAMLRTTFTGQNFEYPAERYEIDHTPLDFLVLCDRTLIPLGRPVITVVIDSYSGYVVGFYVSFYGPSTTSVSGALRCAIFPKDGLVCSVELQNAWLSAGIPALLLCDNGLEFHAKLLGTWAGALGMDIQFARVRTPWTKARVERFFRDQSRFGLVSGRILKRRANDLYENPTDTAAITLSNLIDGLVKYAVDIHSQRVNERTLEYPLHRFEEGLKRMPPAEYCTNTKMAQLILAHEKKLTVDSGGVRFAGLRYDCTPLNHVIQRSGHRQITVKFDPDDLDQVYAVVDESGVPIALQSRDPEYTAGLSWNQHQAIRRYARKALKEDGVGERLLRAKQELWEHWANATHTMPRKERQQLAIFSGASSARSLFKSDRGESSASDEGAPLKVITEPSTATAGDDLPVDEMVTDVSSSPTDVGPATDELPEGATVFLDADRILVASGAHDQQLWGAELE
ncbi:Mu transposase C-terminal domain-containing protein [Piscinibacterium candidicorallinum]|uniref:Mu transposase C-terminal domain-containing protein n=1 Tax=Piscinibacterium candidicorallinum TaxID=1793872 RepID=A0ABV7H8T9_9BURK